MSLSKDYNNDGVFDAARVSQNGSFELLLTREDASGLIDYDVRKGNLFITGTDAPVEAAKAEILSRVDVTLVTDTRSGALGQQKAGETEGEPEPVQTHKVVTEKKVNNASGSGSDLRGAKGLDGQH